MAKFKTKVLLNELSGSLNRTDRTIGRPRALHATMRKTRNGLILAKKPISVKNGSLAKKLRVSIYCNCDETYKTLTPQEIGELKILHQEYNAAHRYKPVKLLYHFWMKLCMSGITTYRTNCNKITGTFYDVDLGTLKKAEYTKGPDFQPIAWPSINDNIQTLNTQYYGDITSKGAILYGSYGQGMKYYYDMYSNSILIAFMGITEMTLNTSFIGFFNFITFKIEYVESEDQYYLQSGRMQPMLGVPNIRIPLSLFKNNVIAITERHRYAQIGEIKLFFNGDIIAHWPYYDMTQGRRLVDLWYNARIRNLKESHEAWTDEQVKVCSKSLNYTAGA